MSDNYPPISDYGYIADCHAAALISSHGSIDWCCMPRMDSRSCFGRLLGWEIGGYCQISPQGSYTTSRKYIKNTLILETTFNSEAGRARLLDFFPMREGGELIPYRQILRIAEGLEGSMNLLLSIVPRFDYGAIKPWIKTNGDGSFVAIGGSDGLLISGNFSMKIRNRHDITAETELEEGRRLYLSMLWQKPENLDEGPVEVVQISELDRRLEETREWWLHWSSQGKFTGDYADESMISALVLKGLTNAPTGAIAAAATSSLPETPGGTRNWDYRFTWVRDSTFAVRSLRELGFGKEADGFRRFIERSAAGSAEELQILFGLGGERRIQEIEIPELEGYRQAAPVRIGNDARIQMQLDVYGELLDLAWRWHELGYSPDNDYWEFLVELINEAAKKWQEPDCGIWEIRDAPRHFVHSKVMCWSALDRGIKLAKDLDRQGPLDKWQKVRDEIRQAVETKGYDRERGVFIQAFGQPRMDAALLLIPLTGFIDYRDERMVRTTDAIRDDLMDNGLIRRYKGDGDGLQGKEGAFLACSFWLVECLARQGRMAEAHTAFQQILNTRNDLGLFSEEYDITAREMLGNFPQGLTHLSQIAAAVTLDETKSGSGK
jgi:GH15 family glucan-1,4-alpha-glucosidase